MNISVAVMYVCSVNSILKDLSFNHSEFNDGLSKIPEFNMHSV